MKVNQKIDSAPIAQMEQKKTEQVAQVKAEVPKINGQQLQNRLDGIKEKWIRPDTSSTNTQGDSLTKAEQAAQRGINNRLNGIHVPIAFASDNPSEREEKLKIAQNDISKIKNEITEFYKGMEQKQLTRGAGDVFKGFGEGTPENLDRLLEQRFKRMEKGDLNGAQELRKDFENAGKAAFKIAEHQAMTKGSEEIIGNETKAKLDGLATRACGQIQNNKVNDAQKTIAQYERTATTAFQNAAKQAGISSQTDSQQQTAQTRDTSVSTQRQTDTQQQTTQTRDTTRSTRRPTDQVRAPDTQQVRQQRTQRTAQSQDTQRATQRPTNQLRQPETQQVSQNESQTSSSSITRGPRPRVQTAEQRFDQLANRVIPKNPRRTKLLRLIQKIRRVLTLPFLAVRKARKRFRGRITRLK